MERWSFTTVSIRHSPMVQTTEPSLVNELHEELKKIIPSARIASSDGNFEKLGIHSVRFDHLNNMDEAVNFWIGAKLCELGWEPIGYSGFTSSDVSQFRRRTE